MTTEQTIVDEQAPADASLGDGDQEKQGQEPDLKTELAAERAKNAELEQRAKSAAGRLKASGGGVTQADLQRIIMEVRAGMVNLRREILEHSPLDEEEKAKGRAEIASQEQMGEILKARDPQTAILNLTVDVFGISPDDERVQAIRVAWAQADTHPKMNAANEQFAAFLQEIREERTEASERTKQEQAAAKKQEENRAAKTLELSPRGGTPGSGIPTNPRDLQAAVASGKIALTPEIDKKLQVYWNS